MSRTAIFTSICLATGATAERRDSAPCSAPSPGAGRATPGGSANVRKRTCDGHDSAGQPALPAELRHRRVRLELGPAAAAHACGHVRAAIAAWSVPVNPAVAILLTSDLVINAVTNGAGETITLGIRWSSGQFRVEVHDASVTGTRGRPPTPTPTRSVACCSPPPWRPTAATTGPPRAGPCYYVLAPDGSRTNSRGSAASQPSGLDRGLPLGEPRAGTVNREPPEVHRPRRRRRRLPPRRHARHRVSRPRPLRRGLGGASSRGVYDRQVRCRLAFWSGISRRPRAAASAAPTHLEQEHEDHRE